MSAPAASVASRRAGRVRVESEPVGTELDVAPVDGALKVEFDITVVDGEQGRRLAVMQAEAVLDVLTWMHDRHRADPAPE